ncbi:MAG: hypothetical protein ACSHWN_04545 [Methylophilaceae bacterium]
MKNHLTDLNDHLFAQMERLNDETLEGEKLESEIKRSEAVSKVAKTIIDNASLVLDATKFKAEQMGLTKADMPALLDNKTKA